MEALVHHARVRLVRHDDEHDVLHAPLAPQLAQQLLRPLRGHLARAEVGREHEFLQVPALLRRHQHVQRVCRSGREGLRPLGPVLVDVVPGDLVGHLDAPAASADQLLYQGLLGQVLQRVARAGLGGGLRGRTRWVVPGLELCPQALSRASALEAVAPRSIVSHLRLRGCVGGSAFGVCGAF